MADRDGELTVAERLGSALDRGLLPAGGPAEAAERLIERLERPARVALLGLPGAGKSSILNLLVGAIVVPETLRLPTIVVQHGTDPRMVCTLSDGTMRYVPGTDLAQVLSLAPALITLELDLPALKVISLLEVSAGPMEAEQRRAASWASKRADIVIWCTTSYLPKEQAVWESLPDAVKDNSFMFLTKTDLLGSKDSAKAMQERVEARAGEEFRQILSISARQARLAMPPGGPVDREMFRDSGASAVITAIKTRVQSGRRADMDTAELLLARHVEAGELVTRRFAEPNEVIAAADIWNQKSRPSATPVPTPAPVAEPEPEPEPPVDAAAPEPVVEPEPEPAPEPEPEPEPVRDEPVVETAAAPEPAETPALDPEAESGTRKRFADRIKRATVEPGTTPLVPLRSTWKSKADLEAASEPEPEPEPVPAPEPTRRPRPTPPDATSRATRAAPVEPEPQRAARPQLFGNRRPTGEGAGNPLPDLSSLRARPEEMEEALADDPVAAETEDELPEPDVALSGPVAEVEPEAPTAERPRLFDRQPRARDDEPAARPRAVATPVARASAPQPAAPADSPQPAARKPAADPDQFSPRAIMARERPAQPDAPAPRRERPRIAARAVPAPAAPPPSVEMATGETALVDAAISLILTRSAALAGEIDPDAKAPVDMILDHARETTEELQAILSRGRSDAMRRINADLGEALDLIMLMQLEKGHAPADDALTLILQLRRELETLRAA